MTVGPTGDYLEALPGHRWFYEVLGCGTFPWVRRQWEQTRLGSLGCLNSALPKDIFLFYLRGQTLLSVFFGVSDRASLPVTFSQRCFQLDQSQELGVQNSFCHTLPLLSYISAKAPQPPGLWGKNDWKPPGDSHRSWAARREASEREVRNSLEEFLQPCSMSCLLPLSWGPNQYGFKQRSKPTCILGPF